VDSIGAVEDHLPLAHLDGLPPTCGKDDAAVDVYKLPVFVPVLGSSEIGGKIEEICRKYLIYFDNFVIAFVVESVLLHVHHRLTKKVQID